MKNTMYSIYKSCLYGRNRMLQVSERTRYFWWCVTECVPSYRLKHRPVLWEVDPDLPGWNFKINQVKSAAFVTDKNCLVRL
jgi:hypothetical protein